ncbi:MAG: hypothetical protein LQ346_001563 [Caloplaca aetnensis]|nr:MAG: hypothetical protein LQ346_001563 [Caloplaca aetnensis]
MSSKDGEREKRARRKLVKKNMPQRHASMHFPERLRYGDDAHDDVTAADGKPAQHMNQSIFSMIAAAGSKTNFHARFEDESSDSEDNHENAKDPAGVAARHTHISAHLLAGEGHEPTESRTEEGGKHAEAVGRRHPRISLPRLKLKTQKERNYMSQSSYLPSVRHDSSFESPRQVTPRDAPVMSQMLAAQARLDPSLEVPEEPQSVPALHHTTSADGSATIADRLMEIFGFEAPEEVISEYPCWLMQSVLLQGYLYITHAHVCFYAYLPKKSNVVAKSGYLAKRGKQNPKFNRYWFTLKGDVLSYFTNPSDLYFPSGNIDLTYGISASLAENKEKGKETCNFSVVTNQRLYHFKADSPTSAKEWVKTLQKVIFRSRNAGDSVKISLPIENIIDIEESPVIDFAKTLKIRVVDSDETYAIDEVRRTVTLIPNGLLTLSQYYFSFFSFGDDALDVLRSMVDGSTAQRVSIDYLSPSNHDSGASSRAQSQRPRPKALQVQTGSPQDQSMPALHDSVRATLARCSPSTHTSPRPSGEFGRSSVDVARKSMDLGRGSFDRGRRSASTSRMSSTRKPRVDKSPSARDAQGSSDSYVHSLDQGAGSFAVNSSSNGSQASASQILDRSDVFHSPTIQRHQPLPESSKQHGRKRSEGSLKTKPVPTNIQIHPPTRRQTEASPKMRPFPAPHQIADDQLRSSTSSPTLQQLVKAGSYPLQRAAGFAGYLRSRSTRMSRLLATESMGYVEKVSGMWAGGRKHYGDGEEIISDRFDDDEDDGDPGGYGDRFRAHFALPPSERLQATFFGYLHRVLPLYGKLYISNRKFCFRSLLPGTKTKMVLPLKDIENVDKEKGFRFGYSGLVIVIRGHEELFFEFSQAEVRDDCAVTLLEILGSMRYLEESKLLAEGDKAEAETAKAEHKALLEARQDGHNEHELKLPQSVDQLSPKHEAPPILFDDPRASILNFKPTESLRITCLTIGSRGDVQPYIALCKGLLLEGHRPKIATHREFEPWVRKHGIDFAPVEGDPAELMRICVENGMFTYSFLREASLKFRGWIDELLSSAWSACRESDILIESPSAMAGIHIAEALGIPYFRAFTMPWTRTRAYPHAFAVPDHKMGGAYNYITYVMFDNVFWKAIAGQVNRWRKTELGLRSTNLDKLQPNKVPFLYNFSPSVVVPPLDYSDWIRVTGYWFLDEASDWTPPEDLSAFIRRARADGKKIVYIGFGSIVVSDPAALTQTVVESVLKADVRCILSKGWSDRLGAHDASKPEVPLPPEILQIKSAPHDWLFKQIDAAAHHGGAGTTGASLRAGMPTIVKPFFGDQFFFGSRIEDLGVGICMKKLNVSLFSRALWEATHSERMIIKAKVLGEQIRKEDGVATAIQAIYRDLEYAKTLIKHRAALGTNDNDISGPGDEESWTFIGDESDPDLVKRIAEWEPMAQTGSHNGGGEKFGARSRALGKGRHEERDVGA